MRLRRRKAERREGGPFAAWSRGLHDVTEGDIEERPDPASVTLERIHRTTLLHTGERFTMGPSLSGQIVEDWLDEGRVYPEPPRLGRATRRLPRLFARVSAPLWLVLVLACASTAARLADLPLNSGSSALTGAAIQASVVLSGALLPAGVLIWRPDAWRSARLVLLGALVWTTLPAYAGFVWTLAGRNPGLDDRMHYGLGLMVSAAIAAGYLGPAFVCFGLERTKRRRSEWLTWVAPRAVSVAALVTVLTAPSWSQAVPGGSARLPDGLAPMGLPETVAGAGLPVQLVCLALLAWVCISSLLADEPQRRLWQLVAAGAAILTGVAGLQLAYGEPLASAAVSVAGMNWREGALTASILVGNVAVLLGFASPVWSAAKEADGPWPTPPERVFVWGDAAAGTAGDPVRLGKIAAIAAGGDHALALDEDGCVGAWGDDSFGQTDVPAGLFSVVAIAAGDGFSLALCVDGTVVAWGDDSVGQTQVPAGLSRATAIAAGYRAGYALGADGMLQFWGDTPSPTDVPSEPEGLISIAAGGYHALALRKDGTVVAWGDNGYGQCNVPRGLRGVKSISAGRDFCLALLEDGTVVAWGDNRYGQLDLPVGLNQVTAVSAGAFHGLALGADGNVTGWGGGGYRLGRADHPWHLLQFDAIAAGDGFSLGLRAVRPGPVHRHDRD